MQRLWTIRVWTCTSLSQKCSFYWATMCIYLSICPRLQSPLSKCLTWGQSPIAQRPITTGVEGPLHRWSTVGHPAWRNGQSVTWRWSRDSELVAVVSMASCGRVKQYGQTYAHWRTDRQREAGEDGETGLNNNRNKLEEHETSQLCSQLGKYLHNETMRDAVLSVN